MEKDEPKKESNPDIDKAQTENNTQEENYFKINTKNQFETYNIEESNKKLNEIIIYVDKLIDDEQSSTDSVWKKILDKLFPKCKREGFLISKLISKLFSKKMTREIVESKLNYFFEKRVEIKYNKKFILNKENINNIGYILCYSYSKFDNFKITTNEILRNYIAICKKKNVNVITDFYTDCNNKRKSPLDAKIFDFLESNTKYLLPGIFFFLVNCFESINIIEINMDLNMNKPRSSDDFYLFIITLLNIHHLVTDANHFKVNFINRKLQKDIYDFFTDELNSIYENKNRYLKKNRKINGKGAYKKRWDFENDYIIMRKNRNDEGDESGSDEDHEPFIKEDEGDRKYAISIANTYYMNNNMLTVSDMETDDFVQINKNINLNRNATTNTEIKEKNNQKNEKDKYDDIVDKNRKILELFCIVILGILRVKKFKNFDLIINDCYSKEYINSFGRSYENKKLPSSINNFHILNFFIKKMQVLHDFNIEFNSLDYLTFYNLLSLIQKNEELVSFQISFFSSLITYTPQYLYKLYTQNLDKKEISSSRMYSPESSLLNELLPYFVENLEALFELIRTKIDKFEILSFNFDIPEIIAINQRYLLVILKFILDILFLVDNHKSLIKKLVILSPKTILDSRHMLSIENIIDSINMDVNNRQINELSLQFQFYQIKSINNFVSHNLTSLKLGDMDIPTLKVLTQFLCSYKFFQTSNLRTLTIGLLYFITHFNKEIEFIFNEIFSIKIKTLLEITVYSNIIIKDQNTFNKILENNWISSCNLLLNEKSESFWKQDLLNTKNNKIKHKKILYLLHHELEEEKLTPNEVMLRKKIKMTQTDCKIAFYLRYILIFKYSKEKQIKLSYYDQKNIVFNILKYLFFTKKAKIEYKYN